MDNYELLINFCNQVNRSISIGVGGSNSHNYLQDKMVELQEQFEELLKEIDEHNADYPEQ